MGKGLTAVKSIGPIGVLWFDFPKGVLWIDIHIGAVSELPNSFHLKPAVYSPISEQQQQMGSVRLEGQELRNPLNGGSSTD